MLSPCKFSKWINTMARIYPLPGFQMLLVGRYTRTTQPQGSSASYHSCYIRWKKKDFTFKVCLAEFGWVLLTEVPSSARSNWMREFNVILFDSVLGGSSSFLLCAGNQHSLEISSYQWGTEGAKCSKPYIRGPSKGDGSGVTKEHPS